MNCTDCGNELDGSGQDEDRLCSACSGRLLAQKNLAHLRHNLSQDRRPGKRTKIAPERRKQEVQRRLQLLEQINREERIAQIISDAEEYFGKPVIGYDAPGGEDRASLRLYFDDTSIIATARRDPAKTELERQVLSKLRMYSQDTPEFLGVHGAILFQSDLGDRRLNREITQADAHRRTYLAEEAVLSIFRLQSAAHKASLQNLVPRDVQGRDWIKIQVNKIDFLRRVSHWKSRSSDRDKLCKMLEHSNRRFLRWDCRAGNAVLMPCDTISWFDFEYARTGHGAEDVGWLIGDETWPIAPDVMEDIVKGCFDPKADQSLDSYMEYLAVFVTFHCINRLEFINRTFNKTGWKSRADIYQTDAGGVHPDFAKHICRVGAYYAARHPETALIAIDFEEAERRLA